MLVEGYEIELRLRLRKKLGEGAQKWMDEICRAAPRADAGAQGHWSPANPGTGTRHFSGMKSFDALLYSDPRAASPAGDVLCWVLGSGFQCAPLFRTESHYPPHQANTYIQVLDLLSASI
jgi:hypothetical protein